MADPQSDISGLAANKGCFPLAWLIPRGAAPKPSNDGETGKDGLVKFEGKEVVGWMGDLLKYARKHGWKGQVLSGYRSYQDQVKECGGGGVNCAKPGTSHHQGTKYPDGAADLDGYAEFLQIVKKSGLPGANKVQQGGSGDAHHISIHGSHRSGEGIW